MVWTKINGTDRIINLSSNPASTANMILFTNPVST